MRYGMMSNFRRGWSEVGIRAVLDQQQRFINGYLFSAVSPITGESFNLIGYSDMDTEIELQFLTELKKQHPNNAVIVVLDNAPCHRPQILKKIEGLYLVYLPSYSPELNPTERFFEESRKETANEVFTGLKNIEDRISKGLEKYYDKEKLKKLIGYDWILSH